MYAISTVIAPSVFWCCWLGGRKDIWPVKTEWWGSGVVICLERGANDLHMVSCIFYILFLHCLYIVLGWGLSTFVKVLFDLIWFDWHSALRFRCDSWSSYKCHDWTEGLFFAGTFAKWVIADYVLEMMQDHHRTLIMSCISLTD